MKAFIYLIIGLVLNTVIANANSRLENEFIYLIMVDRFNNGNIENDIPLYAANSDLDKLLMQRMVDPTRGNDFTRHYGGDLRGVIEKLDYLKNLGVTTIWLTPLVENTYAKLEGGGFSKTSYHAFP